MREFQNSKAPVAVRTIQGAVGGAALATAFGLIVISGVLRGAIRTFAAVLLGFIFMFIFRIFWPWWNTPAATLFVATYLPAAWALGEVINLASESKNFFSDDKTSRQ